MRIITRGWMLKGMDLDPEQGKWLGWRVHANNPVPGDYVPVTIIEGHDHDRGKNRRRATTRKRSKRGSRQ